MKEVAFSSDGQTGNTVLHYNFHQAAISIKAEMGVLETKRTLLHELLHVRFGTVNQVANPDMERDLEVGIEMLVRALLQ